MEASGEQDQAVDGSIPNGIVVVVGLFEPGCVVELVGREVGEFRPGAGAALFDRRVVDEDGEVGFAGLEPGALFFVTGYAAGRLQLVRCVARDPALGVTLLQPPVQPQLTTQGPDSTVAPVVAPAATGDADELGVGLPDGVQSPLLSPPAPEVQPPAEWTDVQSPASATDPSPSPDPTPELSSEPGVVAGDDSGAEGTAGASEPEPPVEAADPTPADTPVPDATPTETAGSEEAEAADTADDAAKVAPGDAPVAPPAPADPATTTSADADVAGGATEVPVSDGARTTPSEQPPEGPVDDEAQADPIPDTPADPMQVLREQAAGLGMPPEQSNGLSEDELRQKITEAGATPTV